MLRRQLLISPLLLGFGRHAAAQTQSVTFPDLDRVCQGIEISSSDIRATLRGTGASKIGVPALASVQAVVDRIKLVRSGKASIIRVGSLDALARVVATQDSGIVILEPGDYAVSSPILLSGNFVLVALDVTFRCAIQSNASAFTWTEASGGGWIGGTFIGANVSGVGGNRQLLTVANSREVLITGCHFEQSPNDAVRLLNSQRCAVFNCSARRNHGTGFLDRGGRENVWALLNSDDNGTTDASSTVGRGILFWRSQHCICLSSRFSGNSEYGLRIYSQRGDDRSCEALHLIDCVSQDNKVVDFYLYNDSGDIREITLSRCRSARHQVKTGTGFAIQGSAIRVLDCAFESSSPTSTTAANLYKTQNVLIEDFKVSTASIAFVLAMSSPPSHVTFSRIQTHDCNIVANLAGDHIVFDHCRFSSAIGETGIDCGTAAEVSIEASQFDGYKTAVIWRGASLVLLENSSSSSGVAAVKGLGQLSPRSLVHSSNSWGAPTQPEWIAQLIRSEPGSSGIVHSETPPPDAGWMEGDVVRSPINGSALWAWHSGHWIRTVGPSLIR